MATKVSKTARASSGKVKEKYVKPCPACGAALTATKLVGSVKPKGMYWVCALCGYKAKIQH